MATPNKMLDAHYIECGSTNATTVHYKERQKPNKPTCFSACLFCMVNVSISSSTSCNSFVLNDFISLERAMYLALYSESTKTLKESGTHQLVLNLLGHLADQKAKLRSHFSLN